jgi:polysaccharide deacetylase family protein (PEP-CTERM system associated)
MNASNTAILLTIDVEEWFHVQNFKQCIPFSSWSSHELRVEKSIHRIFELLDSCNKLETTGQSIKPLATFFILGWIAKRLPHLVREINDRGHEVASHGYFHNLCTEKSHEELRKDLYDSKKLLEDIIGAPIFGYRAPSFSINKDILKIIKESGYVYDSSFNSFNMQGRHRQVALFQDINTGIAKNISHNFYELPISNIKLGNHILPWGGGGYFRLIPFSLFRLGVQSILRKQRAYLFYTHPWEIDPEQPKVKEASMFYRFRHYVNLKKTDSKLAKFMESFNEYRFITCRQYLEQMVTDKHLEHEKP